jgi:hypothetical protein
MIAATGAPRATIVMTARERYDLTEPAIQSIIDNTARPYRLVYADGQSPAWLRELLARRAGEWGLEVVEVDGRLWPNQIRKRLMPTIDTDYVVFIDNDVSVRPGWLERLVACADETGAGIVGPLYLIGSDAAASAIHMAGGRFKESQTADGTILEEWHYLSDRFQADVVSELRREPCDYAEYHCMLIRTRLARETALFDDEIVCVHEHIDAALSARKAGYATYFEPAAEIAYLAVNPYRLSELAFFRSRWGPAAAASSIQAFCAKWAVVDDERSFGSVRRFLDLHRAQVDPVRPTVAAGVAPELAMQADELRQTLSSLFDLAVSRGYRQEEWDMVEQAYRRAMVLLSGAYRPCGRPFINHLAGTASALVRYDFNAAVVAAALLHAAYTHCPERTAGPQSGIDEVSAMLGGRGSPLERTVRAYTFRADRWRRLLASPSWQAELTTGDAAILAIAAANEADMHLSGEYRFSGRRDLESPEVCDLMSHVCGALGVPGLAQTLTIERRKLAAIAPKAGAEKAASIRIVGDKLFPAANAGVRAVLERAAGS